MTDEYRVQCVEDRALSGMSHCGPNPAWVTATHIPTMAQARAYHRSQWKAREMAMACVQMMGEQSGEDRCNFPETLAEGRL